MHVNSNFKEKKKKKQKIEKKSYELPKYALEFNTKTININ